MRIQHNIPAMNAYRNYNNNTSALSKNLEKLSSGYKINRAGDDAAGLAISEKMRAQITGLNAATKNVKDGISLVKTAEGAMQEIQDMLNRMDYLATQSANGTYQDEVDRENLQSELDALRTEINRIADSANFNGINLLDGSLTAGGKSIVAMSDVNPIESSLVDGINPSAAGQAEITVTLGESAQSSVTALDKASGIDGQQPSDATSTVIKISLKSSSNGQITIGGTGFDATSKINTLGSISVGGGKTIADLFNLCSDNTGTISGQGKDTNTGVTDWSNSTDGLLSSDSDGDIYLVAKNPGSLGSAINSTLDTLGAIDGVEVTKSIDVGGGTLQVQPEYNVEIDLTKVAGGQTIEINGKKLYLTDDPSVSTAPAGYDDYLNISGYNRANTGDTTTNNTTDKWTNTSGGSAAAAGGHGELAAAIQGKLNTMLNGLYSVDAVDINKYNTGKYTFHIKGTAGENSVIQSNNLTVDGTASNTPVDVITQTTAYTPAGTPKPGVFASSTYSGFDVSKLTVGSKVNFGGTIAANGTATGGTTLEIVEKQNDQDLTQGKVWLGDCSNDAAKAARLEAAFKVMNQAASNTYSMKINTANKTVTISENTLTGNTSAAMDSAFASGSNKAVSVYINASNDFTVDTKGITGGLLKTGETTVDDLKKKTLTDGRKISDVFDITVTQADGTTPVTGSNVIESGYKITFKAKNGAKLEDAVMDDLNFDTTTNGSNKVSQLVKEGYDEGTGGAAKKTHYDLTFDLSTAKLTGGQSFTFGTDSSKSITFDLSFDPDGTQNGTTIDGETNNEVGGSRHIIQLGNIDPNDAEAMFNEIKRQVSSKMGNDFDVTGGVDSSGTYTLKLDAKTATEDTNLGGVRFSSESGGISGGNYTPAVKSTGGDMGVYAQASWNFDLSKLSEGDTITIGGKSVSIGKESKTEVNPNGTAKSVTLSVADAKDGAKLAAAFETMGFDMGKLAFADKKLTITDKQTGRTGEDFANAVKTAGLSVTASSSRTPKGLTLQIGDTSDDFNQMSVSIGDMHTKAMGTEGGASIADISIGTQASAQDAIQTIKDAINYVSSVRGDLGAVQNRLEHTQNNLSVMAENIQDAESTIRDTDVAEEMMSYVKNNILVQSAQAMLAQANQLPQGVLQLLG